MGMGMEESLQPKALCPCMRPACASPAFEQPSPACAHLLPMPPAFFAVQFVLFLICAVHYDQLKTPQYIHTFQFLYYFSSFWCVASSAARVWQCGDEGRPSLRVC